MGHKPIANNTVLITGGTGTFGKEFIDLCLESDRFEKIIIFSRDEFKQHNLFSDLTKKHGSACVSKRFRFFLGDVRDKDRLRLAFRGVDLVVHAAALKHVPFCEYNPSEALSTNVIGTKNVCDAAIDAGVKRVICLSTDKAVEPINFYGSTKMLAERYAVHSNIYGAGETNIACVRYGNILGSRGSLVEMLRSLDPSKPVPITHVDMTRFWMHISEAARMVMWTSENMMGGEIIIPKIRAAKVTRLADCILPGRSSVIVGVRPGEKMHEQLFDRREHEHTWDKGEYYAVLPESDEFLSVKRAYASACSETERKSYYSSDDDLQMSNEEITSLCSGEN